MVESGVNRKEAVNALFTIVVAQTTLPDMPHVAAKPDLPELVLSSILIADENGLFIFSLCFFISSQTEPYLAIAASHNHGITYQRATQQSFGSSWVCGGPGHYNARENFKSTAPRLRFWVLHQ